MVFDENVFGCSAFFFAVHNIEVSENGVGNNGDGQDKPLRVAEVEAAFFDAEYDVE